MPFGSLWLPVVLSAVGVWIASAIAWMVLPHHRSDFDKLPDEDGFLGALGKDPPSPGQYMFPHCGSMEGAKDPAFLEKQERGPAGIMVVRPSGPPNMGKSLGLWLVYCFVVSFFAAYVARHSLAAGEPGVDVFRCTATIAMAAYVLGNLPDSIWMGRPWAVTAKSMIDGVVYGLVTGGIFCWLWPAA